MYVCKIQCHKNRDKSACVRYTINEIMKKLLKQHHYKEPAFKADGQKRKKSLRKLQKKNE